MIGKILTGSSGFRAFSVVKRRLMLTGVKFIVY